MAGLDKYRRSDAQWLLGASLVLSSVLLMIKCIAGNDTTGKWVYFIILFAVTAINVCSLLLSYRWPGIATQLYSWTVLIAISIMIVYDAKAGNGQLPGIVNVIPIMCVAIACVMGLRSSLLFVAMSSILVVFVGLLYGFGNAIPSVVACIAGGVIVGRLRDKLYSIQRAIRIYTNGGE